MTLLYYWFGVLPYRRMVSILGTIHHSPSETERPPCRTSCDGWRMCQVGRMVVVTIIQLSLALFSRWGMCWFGVRVRRGVGSMVGRSSPAGSLVCLKPWMLLMSRSQNTRIYTALENVKHTHGH